MNSTKSSETKKRSSMELYLRREGIGSSAVCIPIASKKIKIGCDERRSTVVVQGKKISRCHCEIRLRNGNAYVTDSRSRNGTFVNSKRVEREQKLRIGDLIGLGTNPIPLRNFDENQFVYTLCSEPQKVILDEINVELFSFGTAEPDFSGINIDDILKSLEDDSNLEMEIKEHIPCAIYQKDDKTFEKDQNRLKSEQICIEDIKTEPIEKCPNEALPVSEPEFKKRSNLALWEEIDIGTETSHPQFKKLSVNILKLTNVEKFLESTKKSASKRKSNDDLATTPKKHNKKLKVTKLTSKQIEKAALLSDSKVKASKSLKKTKTTSQKSKAMTEPSKSPKSQRIQTLEDSPHPRKRKSVLIGATATPDKNQPLETSTPRMKSTRSDPSNDKKYRVISKKPPKQLKSILVKPGKNRKKDHRKNYKVTFCTSVYIKRYIQVEDEFVTEP